MIQKAELVITDSFHATVVSTLLKTPFSVFEKDSSRPEQNNRIKEFLKSVELDSRWMKNTINCEPITDAEWRNTQKKLKETRQKSLEYLMEALC